MGGFTVGPWFETLGNISLVAFGLGACTGYLLVIGDYATEVMVILLRTTEGEGMAGAEGHESCAHPRPARPPPLPILLPMLSRSTCAHPARPELRPHPPAARAELVGQASRRGRARGTS